MVFKNVRITHCLKLVIHEHFFLSTYISYIAADQCNGVTHEFSVFSLLENKSWNEDQWFNFLTIIDNLAFLRVSQAHISFFRMHC